MKDFVKHVNIFLRFDDWKNPLAKVAVSVPLGALCGPGAPIPNLTNLDRFGSVSKCISAYYISVWAFSGQKCKKNHWTSLNKIEKVVFSIRRMQKVGQNDRGTWFEGYQKIYLGKHSCWRMLWRILLSNLIPCGNPLWDPLWKEGTPCGGREAPCGRYPLWEVPPVGGAGAFAFIIVTVERPRCICAYYTNVWAFQNRTC